MNENKRNRLSKHFKRMKWMVLATLGCMVGAFIPVATVSAVCCLIGGLLIFFTLMYFLIAAYSEGRIDIVSEGIKDSKK